MSSYLGYALNPNTRKVEKVEFSDGYYGSHQYAVRFSDGGIYRESEVEVVTEKTKSTNPLLSENLKPQYEELNLPPKKKKTPEEIEQWVKEMQDYAQKEREILVEYEMNQKAADLLPVLLHLWKEYTEANPDVGSWDKFEGFMQYLVRKNKSITP